MKKRSLWTCHLVMLVALLCALTAPANAQGPTPPPQPSEPASPVAAEAVIDKRDTSTPLRDRLEALRSPEDRAVAAPDTAEADAPAAIAPQASSPDAAQLLVDVSVPDEISAGGDLVYTYAYTNTGTTAASTVDIEAIWTRFSTSANRDWQFCDSTQCAVREGSVVGPAVTRVVPPTRDRARYRLNNLGPGQSGRFSVLIKTQATIYPKTNIAPTRPAGSAQIYLDGATTPSDDDTAATLVVGPALTLVKTAVDRNLRIYPTETSEFVITVGNATGSGDKVNTVIRADARPATNVVVRDTFPIGSEFVSATGNPVVNTNARTLTWTIPGPFNPDSRQEYRVTYRKLDVNADCTRLANTTYNVTSDEYPFNGGSRYDVDGSAASVPVVAPIVIRSVTATPTSVVYGTSATLTIVVQNFWSQPLNGAQLNYDVQTNAYYQPGSASPTPSVTPNSATPGGRVSWTFNMPAGTKTAPSEVTFTLGVLGTYTNQAQAGVAQVIAPSGVPSACVVSRSGRVGLNPRLEVTKEAELDPDVIIDNAFPVQRNQEVAYTLTIENQGNADATNVDITDAIPDETGANFTYVANSATLNGQPREPDSISNGQGGALIWTGLSIPAGGTVVVRYVLEVDGNDYVRYCNLVTATSGDEAIRYIIRTVCVKINPQIEIVKTANRTSTTAGGEVEFTLRLTNREPEAYRVGIYDLLGEFTFVRQISGYADPLVVANGDALEWPLVDLGPGDFIEATIVARVPSNCQTRDYINEGLFHNPDNIVRMIPRAQVKVRVTCGVVEFSKTRDRDTVSLGDRVVYTLNVRNADASAATAIQVDDLLPQGFRYDAMDASSDIKTTPTQTAQDGTTKLSWTINTLESNRSTRIRFIARAGSVVGEHTNRMIIPTGGRCTASCVSSSDGQIYSTAIVRVQPLITIEPSLNTEACAKPGDKRIYKLQILNTNNHDYNSTSVTVDLPFGLTYVAARPNTPEPTITSTDVGTTMRWEGMRVPAKPSNAFASQVTLEVELEIGQVLGNLDTLVQTESADGIIPRKDGVADPTVPVCVTDPTIAIDAFPRLVEVDGDVTYQISLVNTTNAPIEATVEGLLPSAVRYERALDGPIATVNGQTLTWTDVTVPAAAENRPGIVRIRFRANLENGVAGQSYTSEARVTASSVPFDTTYGSVTITAADELFSVGLPLIRR